MATNAKTTAKKEEKKTSKSTSAKANKSSKETKKPDLPELKEFLKAGVQFGHETKRWEPKFERYIFSAKKGIHIIDLSKTLPLLELAGDKLAEYFKKGPIIFLGSKRQASEIVEETAKELGVHYVTNRWAGGFLTNFKQIKASLKSLRDLESQFEEGVRGRTKYEVSQMKKDWERLHRLYGGVKQLDQLPAAVFVVDPGYESGPVRECNALKIPVISIVDSNTDPSSIDYPIPANDDAIGSIKLIMGYMAERLEKVDTIYKVDHKLKDYSDVDVEIKKQSKDDSGKDEVMVDSATVKGQAKKSEPKKIDKQQGKKETTKKKSSTNKKSSTSKKDKGEGGILSKYQDKKRKVVKVKK
jgi:small subunit ribosomal protein S2